MISELAIGKLWQTDLWPVLERPFFVAYELKMVLTFLEGCLNNHYQQQQQQKKRTCNRDYVIWPFREKNCSLCNQYRQTLEILHVWFQTTAIKRVIQPFRCPSACKSYIYPIL